MQQQETREERVALMAEQQREVRGECVALVTRLLQAGGSVAACVVLQERGD